jgi:Phosphopantetheine attachment site.
VGRKIIFYKESFFMDDKKIFEEMVNILKAYAKNQDLLDKATMDTHILNDLKVNSARLVDVIIKCEDVYGISIDDDEADKIRTIGDAVRIIKQKLG